MVKICSEPERIGLIFNWRLAPQIVLQVILILEGEGGNLVGLIMSF